MTPKHLTEWMIRGLLVVLLSSGPWSSGLAAIKCSDVFSAAIADGTRDAIDADYPAAGLRRGADGRFELTIGDQHHQAASATGLATKLVSSLQGNANRGAPLAIYFDNVTPQEAWNFVSTVRLKSSAAPRTVQGVVHSGGDGPPERIRGGGNSGGDGGGDGGGGPPGNGRDDGAGPSDRSEPWHAAIYRPVFKRYDWSQASVAAIDAPPPFDRAAPRWAFQITIPPAAHQPAAGFKFWVLFPGRKSAPDVAVVGATVEATLKDKQLRQAAVQEAAARLKAKLQSTYPGSRSALATSAGDLTIVELQWVGGSAVDG